MMNLRLMISDWSNNKKAKKNSKEPERNPYFMIDYCIIKDKVDHQGIGGKKAYFDRSLTLDDVLEQYRGMQNIAVLNFVSRRQDLFDESQPQYRMPKSKARNLKYHYVKIWNTNESIYPEYAYLGYVIASDEIKKTYKIKRSK